MSLENEVFVVQGSITTDPGFSQITPWSVKSSSSIPNFTERQAVFISNVNLVTKQTKPPGYLTESDLLGLMEKNGIGTDASMPVHINNICDRNYVKVGPNRTLIPTQLGVTLVHGYYAIDMDLVLPTVRADIERSVRYIAKG
mmetsp:Transcript_19429/g.3177  ORF Transcript_19429/g.3177 Transcript_19429/m.3177 type:complete len:142 (+) Transcript_19429:870-1295(+)